MNGKKALLHAYLPLPVAGVAGFRLRAGLGTGAFAGRAFIQAGNADLGFGAARRLLKRDIHVVSEICTAIHLLATAPAAPAKNFAENIAKGFRETAHSFTTGPAAALRVDAGMAVGIVGAAFFRFRENFVGAFRFLEFLLGILAVGIAVRMVFHREFAIGLFNVFIACVAIDAEDVVEVFFVCHVLVP